MESQALPTVSILRRSLPQLLLETDPALCLQYGSDWTTVVAPNPCAIAFPRSIEEVQTLVLLANEHGFSLVPSGGRTGLSGGAVAANQELVVSLEKMSAIHPVNIPDAQVFCQAGAITQTVQETVAAQGFYFPVDFASRGSSCIGGNIATNAGGIKVLRYGMLRDWVMALTVVTGRGEILTLNHGLHKNACGYDLRQLFIGSEGTLGIIIDASIHLAPAPKTQQVLLLAVQDIADSMTLLPLFRHHFILNAFEFFTEPALQAVLAHQSLTHPFAAPAPYYLLIEIEQNTDDMVDRIADVLENAMTQHSISDVIISQNEIQAQQLWQYRDNITAAIAHHRPYKNDLSVKVSDIPTFMADLDNIIRKNYPQFLVIWFGHIADGNLHIAIIKSAELSVDAFMQQCDRVNHLIFERVAQYQGSISAEHGIGLLKKPYLHYAKSAAEIAYMQAIKKIFDPNNIMNPGKLF